MNNRESDSDDVKDALLETKNVTFPDEQIAGPSKMPSKYERVLYTSQSSDPSQSIQTPHEVWIQEVDIKIESDESYSEQNTQNTRSTSNQCHAEAIRDDNEAAQKKRDKQRKYRDKHREEINKRKRESRLNKKNSQSTPKDAKAKERSRIYRERHREEINQRKREKWLSQKSSQFTPKDAKANERSRIYRERHRDEINQRRRESRQRNVRAAGVTIYQNNDISRINTPNIDLTIRNASEVNVYHADVGDLCASQITTDNGKEFLVVVLYISPNQKVKDIIKFVHRRLLPYSHEGSMILKGNLHQLPMILAGDFDLNFATNDSKPLFTFLEEVFQLCVNNDQRQSATRIGTTIDAIFTRHLDNVMSSTFVRYFSYHRPVISLMPSETASTPTITEIKKELPDNTT